MISLTIDGKNVSVPAGTTILDAAAKLGITIPTLCWLQKVSPTGACRVCAVEIEGVDRTMTACNTPVKEGITVITQSERLISIRKQIMELMLVNHPLDCPVCDAGGECGLQDACYGLGATRQEYSAVLERRAIRYDWPLIESDPNRCILCEKCVKVDHEVVGCDAIAVVNRGEATIIDTVDGKPLNCEFCGNCVGSCPTGTLISKPFKFRGRPWAFKVTPSICAFCSSGCQIEYHSRNGKVERVTSDDTTFNSGNLCINGRFGYSYLNSDSRLTTPLIRTGETLHKADWNSAMGFAAEKLGQIVAAHGADAVAGIASPRATNEDNYLFQKLMRAAIGTNNIDSEARFGYAQAQALLQATLGLSGASNQIDCIDTAEAVLVIGCDLNAEATGIEYRAIKAATKNDAKLVLANMRGVKLKKFANSHLQYRPGGEQALLTALVKLLLETGTYDADSVSASGLDIGLLKQSVAGLTLPELAATCGVAESELKEAARLIGGKGSIAVLFGSDIMRSAHAEGALSALINLALLAGAVGKKSGGLFPIYEKTNIQGLLDMGCAPDTLPGGNGYARLALFEKVYGKQLPKQPGKNLWQILEGIEQGTIKALYLFGSDPLAGFPENGRFKAAFSKLELLVVQDIFANASSALAHVVFPGAAAAEKKGTFTSIDNRVQCLGKAIDPPGDAREDWDILTELHNRIAFVSHTATPAEILAEIKTVNAQYGGDCQDVNGRCVGIFKKSCDPPFPGVKFVPAALSQTAAADTEYPFTLLAGPILFHSGTMTTYSENNLVVVSEGYIEFSSSDAGKFGISEGSLVKLSSGSASVSGKVRVSNRVQNGLLFAPHHFKDLNVNALLKGNENTVRVKVEKI